MPARRAATAGLARYITHTLRMARRLPRSGGHLTPSCAARIDGTKAGCRTVVQLRIAGLDLYSTVRLGRSGALYVLHRAGTP